MSRLALCFSKRPHFSRSRGCARSRWLRRWTAFRKDDMMFASQPNGVIRGNEDEVQISAGLRIGGE